MKFDSKGKPTVNMKLMMCHKLDDMMMAAAAVKHT
jgi:hypothetical protein